MLSFIFGRPGSGKTAYMVENIHRSLSSGKQTYFLVPEQQAFISESMLSALSPASALNFEVVSFSRLCEIAFEKWGGVAEGHIGSGVRHLLMWQSLRQVSSLLREYGNTAADIALANLMLSTADELRASSLSPEDCEKASLECAGSLSDKMHDIALVYSNFERLMEERLGEQACMAENKLSRLRDMLEKHDCFGGCHIYVDSFISFTGEEQAILDLIMKQAEKFSITFATDTKRSKLYTESICQTIRRIDRRARELGIEKEEIYLDENKRTESRELQLLEKHLWDFSLKKDALPQLPENQRGHIILTECKNEFEEVYYAALEILKARKEGKKYSDIALIMRDGESRKGIIDAVFEELGIPYFYSERTDLSSSAVCRLVLSALRCIAYNFRSADVMTLLKTGLCGIDASLADLFEDYCYTWRLEGSRFTDKAPWSMNPDGYTTSRSERGNTILVAANKVKEQLISPLLTLKRKFSSSERDAVACCRALFEYLEDIKLSESLTSRASLALKSGDIREAGELLRVYDCLISALSDIATVLGEDRITAEELAYAIEIMLSNTDMGSVPAVGDYVTVGSAATLRVENIKICILLGLCEGEFPKSYSDAGLLSESEKEKLALVSFALESREFKITSDELSHVYRAMTKPSEKLILSTVSSHIGGGTLTPSSAWNRVRFIFNYIEPKKFSLLRIRALAASEELNNSDEADIAQRSPEGECYTSVDPAYVRMLFGDKLYLSKSKISTFAECPYRYWSQYILGLREQAIAEVGYNDAGTIIHHVLEKFISSVLTKEGYILSISDEEAIDRVNKILEAYIRNIECPLPPSMMYSFSRLRDLSLIMVKDLLEEFAASSFRIVALEKPVSDARGALHPMEIKVNNKENSPIVSLGGIIDRIDCYDGEDGRYLRIVDYKTGSKKFMLDGVKDGRDLQLPAYLFTAALENNQEFLGGKGEVFPASAVILSTAEASGAITPVRSGFSLGEESFLQAVNHELDTKFLAGARKNKNGEISGSALSREGILEIRDIMKNTVASTADSMYSGKIRRTPSKSACAYCPLKNNCPVACKEK